MNQRFHPPFTTDTYVHYARPIRACECAHFPNAVGDRLKRMMVKIIDVADDEVIVVQEV